MMKLNVLSIGYTRELLQDDHEGDTFQRLLFYKENLNEYHLIAHSRRKQSLLKRKELTDSFCVYGTNARNFIHSWFCSLLLSMKLIKQYQFDLIQAQDPIFTGILALILKLIFKLPYNVCVYGPNPYDPYWTKSHWLNRFMGPIAKLCLKNADSIQVDGTATLDSFSKNGIAPDRIWLKPMIPTNIIKFEKVTCDQVLRAELTDDGKYTFLALFVGRLTNQKNLSFLLLIAKQLCAEYPACRFVCVGDGEELESLQKMTQLYELEDNVLWLGRKEHAEVVKYFGTCDCFVLPSNYEGGPRVLMESAASGLPVVSTSVSGCSDLISDGKSGIVVGQNDLDAFVEAVKSIIENKATRSKMMDASKKLFTKYKNEYSDLTKQVEIWKSIVEGVH